MFPAGFLFPFYGDRYDRVTVTTEGILKFSGPMWDGDGANSVAKLRNNRMVAPLWDDLYTWGEGDDIFVDDTVADQLTIRWNASLAADGSDLNFSVTLLASGAIEFHYGAGNENLTPTVGISRGDGRFYTLSLHNSQRNLGDASTVQIAPGDSTFVDIGAYEFRGSSVDITPPQVVGTQPAGIHSSASVGASSAAVWVYFSELMNPIDAEAATNYELRRAVTGAFDDGDDEVFSLTASHSFDPITGLSATILEIDLPGGSLPLDTYRLTVRGSIDGSLHDLAGNRLDGDADGSEGPDYMREFTTVATGAIRGQKFHDMDGDGVKDEGEPGLAGWMIALDRLDGSQDPVTVTTDAFGNYEFTSLEAGEYLVWEVITNEWSQSAPQNGSYAVTLANGQARGGLDFGNYLPAVIYGQKFLDQNRNGVRDPDEPGIDGVTIRLLDLSSGEPVTTSYQTVTAAVDLDDQPGIDPVTEQGLYWLTGVRPGTYLVQEVADGQTLPLSAAGYVVTLKSGDVLGTTPAEAILASDGGAEWVDRITEPGLDQMFATVIVDVDLDMDGVSDGRFDLSGLIGIARQASLDTNGDGIGDRVLEEFSSLNLCGLTPSAGGLTRVRLGSIPSVGQIEQSPGGLSADSFFDVFLAIDVRAASGEETTLYHDWPLRLEASISQLPQYGAVYHSVLASPLELVDEDGAVMAQLLGVTLLPLYGVDFGNRPVGGSIAGQKFEDIDGDGVKDPGEMGLAGWTIELDRDADGSVDASATTDDEGNYTFVGLEPGGYAVREVPQAGWTQTYPSGAGTHIVWLLGEESLTGLDFGNRVANEAPVAEAGGPYEVAEDGSIALDGSLSSDEGTIVSYEWDFDGDGQYDDAAGATPSFSALGREGPDTITVVLRVTDDAGATDTDTATINVIAVNDPPVGTDHTVSMLEDTSYTFVVSDFGFTDPHDDPPHALLAVKITTLPTVGSLSLDGTTVSEGAFVSAADLQAGKLRFAPVTNANGEGYASFTFQVRDNGGTANGGVDTDPVAKTITIDVTPAPDVVGRHLFYNNSAFDGNNAEANGQDYNAIASAPSIFGHGHAAASNEPDKQLGKRALLPGQTATFVNYSSYAKGLNGIIIVFDNLANPGALTEADFVFRVGNSNTPAEWALAPAPRQVVGEKRIRVDENVVHPNFPGQPDVVTIIWADENPYTRPREAGAISNQWLQVTVLAGVNTGIAVNDVFYYGSQIGESGNSATDTNVDQNDEIGARNHPHTAFNPALISDPYDYNRDKKVDQNDEILARNNPASAFTRIKFITAPSMLHAAGLPAGESVAGEQPGRVGQARLGERSPTGSYPARWETMPGGTARPESRWSYPTPTAVLTPDVLAPVVAEAMARWEAVGLDAAQLRTLQQTQFVVASFRGSTLGETSNGAKTVYIDDDAAGFGWFIDRTPGQDEEFSLGTRTAPANPAYGKIDLLTAVMHEMGHVLGRPDLDAATEDLMADRLPAGVRRKLAAKSLQARDDVFATR